MKKIPLRGLAILLLWLALPGDVYAQARRVGTILQRIYPQRRPGKARFVRGEHQNRITYGHEAEFKMENAPRLLEWYRPSGKTNEEWHQMSEQSRMEANTWGMVPTDRAPAELQKALSSDPGGAEIITEPVDTLEAALDLIDTVEIQGGGDGTARSKAFYWQGNVAWKRGQGNFTRSQNDGILGYLKATGDYAQFRKLHEGYELHLTNSAFVPGKNLDHGALPPMSTTHVESEVNELAADARNESTSGYGHLLQGTYFRTWAYGPEHSGFEIRDPHKDVLLLKQELRRLTHALEFGFEPYARFKLVTMLNEEGDFQKFSEPVRTLLNGIGHEKRFAIPMRNFEGDYIQALGLTGADADQFRSEVETARAEYVQTLENLAATSLTGADNSKQIHVAIAKFAHSINLYPRLEEAFAHGIESHADFVAAATAEPVAAPEPAPAPEPVRATQASTPTPAPEPARATPTPTPIPSPLFAPRNPNSPPIIPHPGRPVTPQPARRILMPGVDF